MFGLPLPLAGLLNPQALIGGAIALAIAAAAGFGAGWKVESWRWDASLKEAAEARAQALSDGIKEQNERALHQEAIASTFEKGKADVAKRKDAVIADLRADVFILRDPGLSTGSTTVTARAGECDGGAPGKLSRPASEFLLGLASDADEVTKQLAACQAVVRSDRERKK
jgi:prophage endopeptidase